MLAIQAFVNTTNELNYSQNLTWKNDSLGHQTFGCRAFPGSSPTALMRTRHICICVRHGLLKVNCCSPRHSVAVSDDAKRHWLITYAPTQWCTTVWQMDIGMRTAGPYTLKLPGHNTPGHNPSPAWRCSVVVSGVRRMNEVNRFRARLVPGWVTVFGLVYHLGM